MAPLLRFETAERGFARKVVERRSPQAGILYIDRLVESDAVHSASDPVSFGRRDIPDTPSGVPVVSTPPLTASTKALVGLIVFLSVVVLGVAGIRLRKFLRSRKPKTAKSPYLKPLSLCRSPLPEKIISEKRNPMYTQTLIDFGYDGLLPPSKAWTQPEKSDLVYSESDVQYAGWVPQIRSWSEDTKNVSSPDLLPRPFLVPPPPARAAVKQSRFSRLAAVFTRSPRPSVASFDVEAAPPYSSAAPTPRGWSSSVTPSPLATTSVSRSSSDENQELDSTRSKAQNPPRNLPPILVHAPSTRIPRVPVPTLEASPVQETTGSELTQTVLVEPRASTPTDVGAVKSPTRVDSANLTGKFVLGKNSDLLQMPSSPARAQRKSAASSKRPSSHATPKVAEPEDEDLAAGRKVPRLVTVVNVFTPNLDDELDVRLGEVLRLTHEYRDSWCAVERLGKDEERGVVPRFCIEDRASIVPGRPDSSGNLRLAFTGSLTDKSNATVTKL